ncbi:MAG: primosomal protein N' [Muribaculaceae bacterium]|nr:primosomal protein N' [Muribaculaceae bacterium]
MAIYAEVIVPVPIPATFTYIIPDSMKDRVGLMYRVVVPFGSRKYYTGVVVNITDNFKGQYELKEIAWCPDTEPILRRPQLSLWEWIAEYYMCPIGDVLKAALPSGLKIESETIIEIRPDFNPDNETDLTAKQATLWGVVKTKEKISVKELEKEGLSGVMSTVYELIDMGAITVREKLTERFRPKQEQFYLITIERNNDKAISAAFSCMRSTRHQRLLMKLIQLSNFTNPVAPLKEVPRSAVDEEEYFDTSIIKSFVKKGYIRVENRTISRFQWTPKPVKPLPELSDAQSTALKSIHHLFGQHPVVLLHGVTSSGKTEIYIHLIDFILHQNKQVLLLVPEIALTTQLTGRIQDVFGEKVLVYHSRFSDAQRVEVWKTMLNTNRPLVVIGARSAVFLPFAQLGLVIVDEEHEQSYKQFDPAPRYNARDVATVLSRLHGAKTLLCSATPSVETYWKAANGRYGLVTLSVRYGDVQLPEMKIVDLSKSYLQGGTVQSLAEPTVAAIDDALGKKEQTIIFHNRRGFSPIARCKMCEYIPRCTDCDVSLSYHKRINRLVCHYCGKEYALPTTCPVCHQPTLEVVGFGTERIEDDISENFPKAKVLRMDLDTTRNKENYATIIDDFSNHKADILVGTQMVTKGLDFGDVSTVVVLNADLIINYPDFRAAERAFNMLEQVAGRAGRRSESGKVIVQTRQPDHPIIQQVLNHDYYGFYETELKEREAFAYPPFIRIIYIFVRHREANICQQASEALMKQLTAQLGNRVLGPHEPPVNRIKNMYIRRIMVKIETGVSLSQIKQILTDTVDKLRSIKDFRAVDIYFDVDPM